MRALRISIVGAGIGGLTAALALAAAGCEVTVFERAAEPGGKMRRVGVGGALLDAGPTVFTMRPVFEEIFAAAGANLADHVGLRPAGMLARHAWGPGETLDLFADIDRSTAAIGDFAGAAAARGYRDFCLRAQRIYAALEAPFIRAARPSPAGLVRRAGWRGLPGLSRINPFQTMWGALGRDFADPRLRQLFGRYATYCGSSPFRAPATLMLVAHVEREGVWLVEGGMHRLAAAMAALAAGLGARLRCGAHVAAITTAQGRASGVRLASGEHIEADAVIVNADAAALAGGLFGPEAAAAVPPLPPGRRSHSAVTWAVLAPTEGFALARHNVFFSADSRAEFAALHHGRLPDAPSVYVCAQDRDEPADASIGQDRDAPGDAAIGPERLLCLVNAPATGDTRPLTETEIDRCTERSFAHLEQCGLTVHRRPEMVVTTTPAGFERLYPGTGGALYGAAVHGALATFRRPGARSRLPGLYLAGGSTHPGAGVPMAALSGRLAAASVLEDGASTATSRPGAMPGGMSTRSATTEPTG